VSSRAQAVCFGFVKHDDIVAVVAVLGQVEELVWAAKQERHSSMYPARVALLLSAFLVWKTSMMCDEAVLLKAWFRIVQTLISKALVC
jgi:hypothetical protein